MKLNSWPILSVFLLPSRAAKQSKNRAAEPVMAAAAGPKIAASAPAKPNRRRPDLLHHLASILHLSSPPSMARAGGKSRISGRQSAARPSRRRPRFVVVGFPPPPPPALLSAVAVGCRRAASHRRAVAADSEVAKAKYMKSPEEQQEYEKIFENGFRG